MVDRLYGSSISLSKWDKERKKSEGENWPSCGIIFIISNRHSCFGNSCIMDS